MSRYCNYLYVYIQYTKYTKYIQYTKYLRKNPDIPNMCNPTEQRDIVSVEPMDKVQALALFEKKLGFRDPNPEVLVINIIEVDNDGGVYADGGNTQTKSFCSPLIRYNTRGRKYSPCRDAVSIRKARRIAGE
ncbi:hypothetical protein BU26DRAFT_134998 [Trematosphaeria pertusa]|uniref:Uncharacterized protein n=1 Tax=Trematosphaeria pertusa TaxID=390896 RepID=A0A6A6IX65_9PLEO|nr:uncharacterized protein BU26DRAFT_134998 [Trematosphaeria pertusa]KAF2254210.1 hypothetical protein BU26DRAFT_134998 [Trematosphaeria pertusa]